MGDLREVAQLAERAANMFQTQGSAESAAASLDKAAKVLEQQRPAEALRLFQHAAEISMIQDSTRQAAEYTSKVARLHVKLQQYDLAADAIRRELGLHQQNESYQATGRLTVALVLVQLARGDVVAAEKAFKEWGNYCEGPEVQTLEALLQAYDEEDPEGAKRALNSPFISTWMWNMRFWQGICHCQRLLLHQHQKLIRIMQQYLCMRCQKVTRMMRYEIPQCTVEAGDTAAPPISEAPDDEDEYAGGLC
nr:unnamed protein product [Callosobruchus chinensis]